MERDSHGLPWHASPICHRVGFATTGVTLDADERESLAQYIEGARRLYRGAAICVSYGPESPEQADARVDYLRWWLGLQGVSLTKRSMKPAWMDLLGLKNGGQEVELQIGPCGPVKGF